NIAIWGGAPSDTTVRYTHAAPTGRRPGSPLHAVGFVILPRDVAATTWVATVHDSGTTRRQGGRGQPLPAVDGIVLSDIVTANESAPLRWAAPGEPLPVDPGS